MPLADRLRHVAVGGQGCHALEEGTYTGSISAWMLADGGARFVLAGHSEQRAQPGCGDAQAAELDVILCVGEGAGERDEGRALSVVVDQLLRGFPDDAAKLLVAYEPVWSGGGGGADPVGRFS